MQQDQKIVIMGAGESGVGAAILAKKQGLKVLVSDNGQVSTKYREILQQHQIEFEENGHTLSRILEANEVIKSPGIPDNIPVIKAIREKNIPIISEIEFASRYTTAKLICITGSNGKTTTTLLLYHILKNGGLNVGLAGNVGQSFAWQVALYQFDVYVLEISSFQLDGMFTFRANIAIITNITPDHLDRYQHNFDLYAASKLRILQNQQPEDALIYNADDPVLMEQLNNRTVVAQLFPFTLKTTPLSNGAYIKENKIIIKHHKIKVTMTLEQLALQGKHNTYNSMAAGVASKLMDIRNETLKSSMSDYHNIAHRLEYVSSVHGISFINDSKATNVNSTWYAMEYVDRPTVWIVGGIDKGNDYSPLMKLVKQKVKAIICLGLDNTTIHQVFGDIVPYIVDTETAEEAVAEAYQIATKGDVVLLSPACASYDLFESYEERGNQFKQAVNKL
ncbi:MAG: UDP-N-acetylmuramoyl-L-alanine--D-glutamate ligase [Bacteroidales bacterium]|nr:UDP-N-acetylmuramoyl-L-alanine--D-glutamate ligase [Bacteroidales bacterium]